MIFACPKCGSPRLGGTRFMDEEVNWICQDCGHRWRSGVSPEIKMALPTEVPVEVKAKPLVSVPAEAPIRIVREEVPKIPPPAVVKAPKIDIEKVNEALSLISALKSDLLSLTAKVIELSGRVPTEERIKSIVDSSVAGSIAKVEEMMRRIDVYIAFSSQLSDAVNVLKERRKFCTYLKEPNLCKLWRTKTGEPTTVSELECALCNTFELKGSTEWRSAIEGEFRKLLASLESVFSRTVCPSCKFEQYAPKFLAGWACSKCGHYITWASLTKG